MAEQEITKHTKKVYKIWNSKEHSWKHKLKEFFIEIFIIVFAVTVSIWFHNMSEKKHGQEEVKVFLTGLKGDMEKDLKEMQEDTMSYGIQKRFFKYLYSLKPDEKLDSLRLADDDWTFQNTTALIPNISRFEALKYSGLMGKMENKELLDEILNLYEEQIPNLVQVAENTSSVKINTIGVMLDSIYYYRSRNVDGLQKMIHSNQRFTFDLEKSAKSMQYVYHRYEEVLKLYRKVLDIIGKELK
jgi:hypothetical protein